MTEPAGTRPSDCGWRDRWLWAALLIGLVLGAQGFFWGRYDCLNLDRMAFQNVQAKDRGFLEPSSFVKPPFYTYWNLVFAKWPGDYVAKQWPGLSKDQRKELAPRARLFLARVSNLAMFAGLVALVYFVAGPAFGTPAARGAALILASSAGFVPYQVFLTTDLALVFFMMATLGLAVKMMRNPTIGISLAAGLLAGLSAAVKYNGLAVAACLPLAQLFAGRGNLFLSALRRPSAWLCGLAVPVGFVLGNPYAVLNFPKFWDDFLYNYTVTPVYDGATSGHGYGLFFARLPEIFGWPGSWIIGAGVVIGILALAVGRRFEWREKVWLLAAAVFALYFWKIGSFPRMETRFVLPTAPFLLLLAAAGFAVVWRLRPRVSAIFLTLLLAYNLACGWWTGELFRKDPRMLAVPFVQERFLKGQTVETSGSCPQWRYLGGLNLKIFRIPTGLERRASFSEMFSDDAAMLDRVAKNESSETIEWFSASSRAGRNPDWITWSTIDLEGVAIPFFEALQAPGSGFSKVFDAESPSLPSWTYPRYTEFLRNRLVILQKSP